MSGHHAKLVNDGDRWKLLDDLSQNGTFVNGKLITMCYLSSGDELLFGRARCTFQLPLQQQRPPRLALTLGSKWVTVGILLALALGAIFVVWVMKAR